MACTGAAPSARRAHAGVILEVGGESTLAIHGGRDKPGDLLGDVWATSLEANEVDWRCLFDPEALEAVGLNKKKKHKAKEAPLPRKGHVAISLPDKKKPLMVRHPYQAPTPYLDVFACSLQLTRMSAVTEDICDAKIPRCRSFGEAATRRPTSTICGHLTLPARSGSSGQPTVARCHQAGTISAASTPMAPSISTVQGQSHAHRLSVRSWEAAFLIAGAAAGGRGGDFYGDSVPMGDMWAFNVAAQSWSEVNVTGEQLCSALDRVL